MRCSAQDITQSANKPVAREQHAGWPKSRGGPHGVSATPKMGIGHLQELENGARRITRRRAAACMVWAPMRARKWGPEDFKERVGRSLAHLL